MPLKPTKQQREIIENKHGLFTVRACPGSGKTFTVAARLNHALKEWPNQHRGVAVASFTNVAWKEIADYLALEFERPPLGHPHFLGTLDSFINKYVFLPYGHLVMPSKARPILTGPPHDDREPIGSWIWWQSQDCNAKGCLLNDFTYDMNQNVIRIGYSEMGHKCSVNGRPCTVKKPIFTARGLATQSDAIVFSVMVLKKYPAIAKALAYRFPFLIVDEAQDTSVEQMAIIDLLIENGLREVMLVGDPDQAIYEWREAEPSLFLHKCSAWKDNSASLSENWRSSRHICQAANQMCSSAISMTAANPKVADYVIKPSVMGYASDNDIPKIVKSFIRECSEAGIAVGDRYALTRSKELVNVIVPGTFPGRYHPWSEDAPLTGPLAHAKYLYDQEEYSGSMRMMERIVYRKQVDNGQVSFSKLYPTSNHLAFRAELFSALERLPKTADITLGVWVQEAQAIVNQMPLLGVDRTLKVKRPSKIAHYPSLHFNMVFGQSTQSAVLSDLSSQTVHAAKGTSLDAVLIVLKKKGASGPYYSSLIAKKVGLHECEELRIVYVALTRAKRILWLLVPGADQAAWSRYLGVN